MNLIRHISIAVTVAALGFLAATPARADLEISPIPLFLIAPVKPALLMAIDDSGSMDSEVIFNTNDGALWWHATNRSFGGLGVSADGNSNVAAPGVLNFNQAGVANGTWKKYVYLFPNGQDGVNGHRRRYRDAAHDHYAIAPLPQFAFARSPTHNLIYFDPFEVYPPFPSEGTQTFVDADPRNALSDAPRGNSALDLTQPVRSTADHWVFRMYAGMQIPAGTTVRRASSAACSEVSGSPFDNWVTLDADITVSGNNCSVAIEYFPATFWLPSGAPLPPDYGFTGTPLQGGLAPDGTELVGYEIRPGNFATTAQYDHAIQSFANWFQYYRKRSLATRAAIGRAFAEVKFLRVGYFTINNRSNVVMRDLEDAADRIAFFDWHYGLRPDGGTPNKEAVHHMGNQFRRTGSNAPILLSCQRNFGMLFTDGYANSWTGAGVGNADGGLPPPLGDAHSNTMADIAYYHFINNLRPDLDAGDVPVPSQCRQPSPPLHLNCNSNPHMTFYGVTLGTPGLIFGVNEAATNDPWNNHPTWPGAFPNRHPSAVDDLWHATLNTRGALFSVTRPGELVEAIQSVLRDIAARVLPSGVSATSTRLDTDSNIFIGSLDSTAWSGDLVSRNARTQAQIWSAEEELPAADQRNIRTSFNGTEMAFDLSLPAAVRERIFGSTHDTDKADQIIRFIRGERDGLEMSRGGSLRDRDGLIGDIVNSRPIFTGAGNEGWTRLPVAQGGGTSGGGSYGAYIDGPKKNRSAMVLVGANAGKMHVFDAADGKELFAYIPRTVHHKLSALADPSYAHEFFVDGQITIRDVRIGGQWRTVAVMTLGAGGRGILALDITNPQDISLLWELSSEEHSGIGYTFGGAVITRLGGGQWVAIFGNGYNSDEGRARLFVVDVGTGDILQTIDAGGAGSNGLSGAVSLLDPQTRLYTSRIYAGDLQGTMWRFDFDANGTGSLTYNNGLFRDPNGRAITATPNLAAHPDGGMMVLYGSGKLIEQADRLSGGSSTDRFWVLRDQGTHINNINQLGQLTMTMVSGERVLTPTGSAARGWYLSLAAGSGSGERVLSRPQVLFGNLVLSTFEPQSNPCATGGLNRLYVLEPLSGQGRVIDAGEGAPIDPAIFINPPESVAADEDTPIPGYPADPDNPDPPPAPPSVDPDEFNPVDWCSDMLVFNPNTGDFIEVDKICEGRQVWRQAR